mgnify:FL=1
MRAEDITLALLEKLPKLVDDFTSSFDISNVSIISATPSESFLEITTATDHGLITGNAVFITNVFVPVEITSFTRSGILGTIVTTNPHDLTTGSQTTANIQGANESEFNGDFTIQSIPDRNTFTVIMPDSGATTATGTLLGVDIGSAISQVGGIVAVTSVPTTTTFQYSVPFEVAVTPFSDLGKAKTKPRISSAISRQHVIDSYPKQATNEAWLFVVMGDAVANKSKDQTIDSVDNIQRTQFFNQKFAEVVDIFVVFPATQSINGRSVSDRCRELLQPICQCVLFKKFDSLLTAASFNPLQFTSAGFEAYNTATYIHRYSFEQTNQMQFADTVGYDEDVAFRDIALTQQFSTGNEELVSNINLDDNI